MALFLISSGFWKSFCQAVQQAFPIRGKALPDRKYVFQNPDKKLKKFLCLKDLDGLMLLYLHLIDSNDF